MKKIVLILSLILVPVSKIFAGGGNPPAPGSFNPPPAFPIDQYLIPLFIAGLIVYFWQLKLRKSH